MKINDLNYKSSINTIYNTKNLKTYSKETDKNSFKTDTVEIQDEGKKLLYNDMSARSGEDILGIEKGKFDNTFVVHFSRFSYGSKAVSRGYIMVNGKRIELSEEDKKAEELREYYLNMHSLEHNMKVAKQQGAVWELYFKEEEKILKSKQKLAKGEKLTPEEEKMILERDPEGYQMAVMIRNMKKNKKENSKISSIQDKA